jgi:chemotaxis protein CheD
MVESTVSTRPSMSRIHDRSLECDVVRLLPGEFFVSGEEEVLTTVLGSCVSACIRDPASGIGGMNHFMLPNTEIDGTQDKESAGRYGTHAMEFLIEGILKLGGRRDNLEVKLFGGGKIVEGMSDVGKRNIDFVHAYLADSGITVAAEDLGLAFPRKINYFVPSGRVMVKKLRALHSRSVLADEQSYQKSILGE